MKILVVDDETPARERLVAMLDGMPTYEVCGEAANGVEALRLTSELGPDIVLMDVRMPGMDGLEAARHLAAVDRPPAVVFTTAYGEHALEAFQTQSAGYLLKPIRRERLEEVLARASRPNKAQLANIMGSPDERGARTHICARMRGRIELVPVSDIIYFQADQKYVTVRHVGGEVLIEESLKSLEREFGPLFLRVHRNALAGVTHLAGMEKTADGRFQVVFREREEALEVSRRHVAQVRRFFKDR
jgi:two-component system response regulator AlgR